ncbi:response regulator transcription factor [Sulfurospirillum arcachonense]|uniref:response regulator transcription factor n=1 Tax=Sulfurospirillum arcachonense TaxID=57666 RepID=UPI000468F696|nr:response regulator transcription factor [Sulfurospirillum arcachonense]
MNDCSYLDILADKQVLCADDEKGVLNNIVEILEMFFQKVTGVNDGEKALFEAKTNLYDVLIFDISMPNMDGLAAIKEIRKINKKIPIIILSAHMEQEYLWRAVDLKITKYLTKPCDRKALFSALNEAALELVDYNATRKLSDNCAYNYCTKQIEKDDEVINLSKSESRLLEYFLKRTNEIVTYEYILDYMWEFEKPSKEAIKSIVKELRKKIDTDFLKNIYGVGYMCEV